MESTDVLQDCRRANFFMVDNVIIDEYLNKMEVSSYAVYSTLIRHLNQKTKVAFPGFRRIMELTGLSKPTISKAIKELEELGLIEVSRTPGQHNVYSINAVVKIFNRGGKDSLPVPVKLFNPNNTKLTKQNNNMYQPSEKAIQLVNQFKRNLEREMPKVKLLSDFKMKWAKTFDDMMRIDERPYIEITQMVDHVFDKNASWWAREEVVRTPCKFRKRSRNTQLLFYDMIKKEMDSGNGNRDTEQAERVANMPPLAKEGVPGWMDG